MINYRLKIDCQGDKILSSDMVFVSGDVKAYKLILEFRDGTYDVDTSDCVLMVRARRADGSCVDDAGEIVDGKGIYVPRNSIYAVPGEVRLEIALCDSAKSYVTTKIITAEVIEGIGNSCEPGKEEVSVFVSLVNQLQAKIDAMKNLAEEELVSGKLSMWMPNTGYHAGEVVLAQVAESDEVANDTGAYMTVGLVCTSDHTSANTEYLLPGDMSYWDFDNSLFIQANKDSAGHVISEYYASKDEVSQYASLIAKLDGQYEDVKTYVDSQVKELTDVVELNWVIHDTSLGEHEARIIANETAITELQTQTGKIELALDGIIDIQNSLIGGDGV